MHSATTNLRLNKAARTDSKGYTCPTDTPWGAADGITILADGIFSVSTSSHGGIKLAPYRNAKIPAIAREPGGWYEEDCQWSIPFIVFESDILAHGEEYAVRSIRSGHHKATAKNWEPDFYEAHFGEVIPPCESHVKDQRRFREINATRPVVISATSSDKRPGWIECIATLGGIRGDGFSTPAERYFFVEEKEFDERGHYGYVIDEDYPDPAKWEETTAEFDPTPAQISRTADAIIKSGALDDSDDPTSSEYTGHHAACRAAAPSRMKTRSAGKAVQP